jgi:small subunit ribosomal protein S15
LRLLHTSLPSYETARKRVSRLKKSKHQTKRADNARRAKDNRAHPALGYGPGREALWTNSKLCQLLITEDQVQKLPVPALELELEPESVRVRGQDRKFIYDYQSDRLETKLTGQMVPKLLNGRAVVMKYEDPKLYNYGIGEGELELLKPLSFTRSAVNAIRYQELESRRMVDQQTGGGGSNVYWSVDDNTLEKSLKAEDEQVNEERNIRYWFGRLLDIKNASAQGLEFENKKRIVAAFSTQGKEHDPGLQEVQGMCTPFPSVADTYTGLPLTSCSQNISHSCSMEPLASQKERHSQPSSTGHDDSRTSQDTSLPTKKIQSEI